MFAARRLDKIFNFYSSIHVVIGCRCSSDYKAHESSKFMQKLINKHGAQAKRKWYQPHIAEPLEMFTLQQQTNKRAVTPAQRTRARQLSHVLYDKITHIVNTGELSEEILHKQVLITSVKMQTDFGGVNVYWDSSRSDAVEVESLLQARARKLRSLLISYHVLGRIPPITFVKDKAMGDQIQLKQLFDVADYGSDNDEPSKEIETQTSAVSGRFTSKDNSPESAAHTDTRLGSANVANRTNVTTCTATIEENGNPCSDSGFLQSSEVEDQQIDFTKGLNFRSNLYSLPHEDLMKKVTACKSKVKDSSSQTLSSIKETLQFDVKQLNSRKDKLKLMSKHGSNKLKQQILQMDAEDLNDTSPESDDYTDEQEDDYNDIKGN